MSLRTTAMDFLSASGVQFDDVDTGVPDGSRFSFMVDGEAGMHLCFLEVHEAKQWVRFRAMLELSTPEERFWEVMHFVTMATCGGWTFCFEMESDTGLVRCRNGFDIEGGVLGPQMLENLVGGTLAIVDRYHPGLMAVINGTPAREAIAAIEG